MSTSSNSKPRPRIRFVVLAAVIVLPLLYYGAQVLLRSAPLGGITVIGHRGGRAYAPENTLIDGWNFSARTASLPTTLYW